MRQVRFTALLALAMLLALAACSCGPEQILSVELESHPSIGAFWRVDDEVAREFVVDDLGALLLGAPAKEKIYFKAPRGTTSVPLTYEIRGEAVEERIFKVQRAEAPEAQPLPEPAVLESRLGAPSEYNWCDVNACPIRDQGNCGSCWAFATNTATRAGLLGLPDLSEQYLVNCNSHGWGCRGGFWAFDYWTDQSPNGLPPGIVLEADAPYVAQDRPCTPPYVRQDAVIEGAVAVANNVAEIKNAIVETGRPVATSMCVNYTFSNWTPDKGVFKREHGCGMYDPNNHAITITGWSDPLQAWRVQNSWGEAWCDGGFIWVEYGASGIGRDTMRLADDPLPPPTPPPTITLSTTPGDIAARPGDSFATEITAEDMENVAGYQVIVRFDPSVVLPDLEQFAFSEFMSEPSCVRLGPQLDAEEGELAFGSLDVTNQGHDGTHPLASVVWDAVASGETDLRFAREGDPQPRTMFLDSEVEYLPIEYHDAHVLVQDESTPTPTPTDTPEPTDTPTPSPTPVDDPCALLEELRGMLGCPSDASECLLWELMRRELCAGLG